MSTQIFNCKKGVFNCPLTIPRHVEIAWRGGGVESVPAYVNQWVIWSAHSYWVFHWPLAFPWKLNISMFKYILRIKICILPPNNLTIYLLRMSYLRNFRFIRRPRNGRLRSNERSWGFCLSFHLCWFSWNFIFCCGFSRRFRSFKFWLCCYSLASSAEWWSEVLVFFFQRL